MWTLTIPPTVKKANQVTHLLKGPYKALQGPFLRVWREQDETLRCA